jgi:hypothetical protein
MSWNLFYYLPIELIAAAMDPKMKAMMSDPIKIRMVKNKVWTFDFGAISFPTISIRP